MKKITLIILTMLLLGYLCSCSELEIDKNAIVNSVYIYNSEEGLKFRFNTIKSENDAILESYETTAEDFTSAKSKLEANSVSNLILGQLQCIIISQEVSKQDVINTIEYFYSGYECSPSTNLIFSTNDAIKKLIEDKTNVSRIQELTKLLKEKNHDVSMNIYTFYNDLNNKNIDIIKVPLLYNKNQLDIKSVDFMKIG